MRPLSAAERVLVELHVHVIERCVRRARARRVPRVVTDDEIRCAAGMGLVDAVTRWNARRGASFATFAERRAWGAVQDYLRSLRKVQQFAGMPKAQRSVPLDIHDDEVLPRVASRDGRDYVSLRDEVEHALAHLDERSRYAVHRHLHDGQTMKEIGLELRMSEANA